MKWYDKVINYLAILGFGLVTGLALSTYSFKEEIGGLKMERRHLIQEIIKKETEIRLIKEPPKPKHNTSQKGGK